jgi:hypothetical protein
MEALIVINQDRYAREFAGIKLPAKSATPVSKENKKMLLADKQFVSNQEAGMFSFEEQMPDSYKTPTQQLNEALAKVQMLESKDDTQALKALEEEAKAALDAKDKEIETLKAEIGKLKAELAKKDK